MSSDLRQQIIDCVPVLASPERQLEHERSLTEAGHAPSELVCGFCDDLFDLKSQPFLAALNREELHDSAHLYGLVVEVGRAGHPSVGAMLKDPLWRRVVAVAKELSARLVKAT